MCAHDPVGKHLQGAVVMTLTGGVLMGEPNVGREDVAERSVRLERRIHDDLFMVVPDKTVCDAVAVYDYDKRRQGAGSQNDAQTRRRPLLQWQSVGGAITPLIFPVSLVRRTHICTRVFNGNKPISPASAYLRNDCQRWLILAVFWWTSSL